MNSLDTNVLIYAVGNPEDPRTVRAKKLLLTAINATWPIAAQVYGEFFAVVVNKKMVSRKKAREVVETWQQLMPSLASSLTAHAKARELATLHQYPFWDALIIATCAENNIQSLYSEDQGSLPKPLGVRVISPFSA